MRILHVTLGASGPYGIGSEKPEVWVHPGVVRGVTLDAVDAEVDVVTRLAVERVAIEAFAPLRKTQVALATVGVPERPAHSFGFSKLPTQIEKRVFDGEQFDSRST